MAIAAAPLRWRRASVVQTYIACISHPGGANRLTAGQADYGEACGGGLGRTVSNPSRSGVSWHDGIGQTLGVVNALLECIDDYLGYLAAERGLADNTLEAYANDLSSFAAFAGERPETAMSPSTTMCSRAGQWVVAGTLPTLSSQAARHPQRRAVCRAQRVLRLSGLSR